MLVDISSAGMCSTCQQLHFNSAISTFVWFSASDKDRIRMCTSGKLNLIWLYLLQCLFEVFRYTTDDADVFGPML